MFSKLAWTCGVAIGMGVLFAASSEAGPEPLLRLPAVFSDHMVLQRDRPIRVWGWASADQSVAVSIGDRKGTAKAGASGQFEVRLPAMPAGGPHEMRVEAGQTITYQDVMIGEVWLASGQSNMELALQYVDGGQQELEHADEPGLRLFQMQKAVSDKPLEDAKGSWVPSSRMAAKDFSAVGYFFARRLQQELKVTLGIINNAWGGTAAEAWTPTAALAADPELRGSLEAWEKRSDTEKAATLRGVSYEAEIADIRFLRKGGGTPAPVALGRRTAAKAFGGVWTQYAKPGATVAVEVRGGAHAGGPALHCAAHLQYADWGGCHTPLDPGADTDLSKYDAVEFAIRGAGSFTVRLGQRTIEDGDEFASPPFVLRGDWQKIRVPFSEFKQGGWGFKRSFARNAVSNISFNMVVPYVPEMPGAVYNGVIAPLVRFPIRGILWYQGESNVDRARAYRRLLPTLIGSWRQAWGAPDLPFLIVQLANYLPRKSEPSESKWAELREAQAMALKVPNTGLAVTIDIGDANDFHPKDKRTVGERLAQWALYHPYRRPGTHAGPLYESATVEKGRMRIRFKNVGKGLVRHGDELWGFAIAGADRRFVWARAIVDGPTVVVWNEQVPEPVAVRYGWADNPVCHLYNEEGFPASPFRTDDWAGGS